MQPRAQRKGHVGVAAAALVIASAVSSSALAQDYGEPGDPVHLTIGYQPYYTQAWSAVVMAEEELWKDHLPEGSTVEWQIGLQGTIVGNAMIAGQQQIGYMGDMPSILTASKRRVDDVRIVGTLGIAYDQCSVFMVRADAPEDLRGEDAIRWFEGKNIAVAKGSCTDRTARQAFAKFDTEPARYLNQNIEVQTSGLRSGRIDGSIIWEPTASKLENEGFARRVASAKNVDSMDAGFLAMRKDLIDARPDVAQGWLKAELEAQRFLMDPQNANAVISYLGEHTEGMSEADLWWSLYGPYGDDVGGGGPRDYKPFSLVGDQVATMIQDATVFLEEVDAISSAELPEGAIMNRFAAKALADAGLPESLPLEEYNVPAIQDVPAGYEKGSH